MKLPPWLGRAGGRESARIDLPDGGLVVISDFVVRGDEGGVAGVAGDERQYVSRKERSMTGYTVHSGTTIKFSEGWDRIFEERAPKGGAKKKSVSGLAKGQAKAKARVKRAAKGRR